MKNGLAQLLEEKNRFTVETQGLLYTTKRKDVAARDEDVAWTDDDSDREDARCVRSGLQPGDCGSNFVVFTEASILLPQ